MDDHICKPDNPNDIKNEDRLHRRIPKVHWDGRRVLQAAFDDDHCSVDLEKKGQQTPLQSLGCIFSSDFKFEKREDKGNKRLDKGWGVAAITGLTSRENGQSVYPEPIDVKFKDWVFCNEAHSLICGIKNDDLLFDLAEEASKNVVLKKES